ncbi:MAG: ATP-binding protein [Candidatus Cloacimonetes bacterium]|nr:ATP-binding protein [Candidatus Cloacimonadota bacterium]
MINDETKRKLRELNLDEVIAALELQQSDINSVTLSFDERMQRLVDYLYQEKYNSKIQRLMKMSKFRIPKAEFHDIYYTARGIDKGVIQELSTCQFIDRNSDIIFQGFTGSGKTFLACALGKQACKQQVRTFYIRLPDLLMEHDESTLVPKGSAKLLKKYSSYKLLILDEWLLEDISNEEQRFLFELIERRHDSVSTIFCTQYRQENWHARLGGGVHADAIMDRIIHNAVWVDTGSMNMREYCAKHQL